MSFFRYPGGKKKLMGDILPRIEKACTPNLQYREPFFGGGSVGIAVLQSKNVSPNSVWVNDYDVGVACLWTAVVEYSDLLKEKVRAFVPSVTAFHEFKVELNSIQIRPTSIDALVELGFKKLAIHQISYSGLGTKSGGPLGGIKQESQYKIDCRWSPDYICKKIDKMRNLFQTSGNISNPACTNLDFELLIKSEHKPAFLYLDPPYYIKGNDLYQCGFTEADHIKLAAALKETSHDWLLSYDDCSEIRDMYAWANVETVQDVKYSITAIRDVETGLKRSTYKPELLITPIRDVVSSVDHEHTEDVSNL